MRSWARETVVILLLATAVPLLALAAEQASPPPKASTPAKPTTKASTRKSKASAKAAPAAKAVARDTTVLGEMRDQATAMKAIVESPAVQAFLDSTRGLPNPGTRTIYMDSSRTHYYSESQLRTLGAAIKTNLKSQVLDDRYYYYTRYGTPLAYSRALDLVAAQGVKSFAGMRILDFGYGGIGHLRLLAATGADVVGVDVDPLLPVLYSQPGDQGAVQGRGGKITLVNGQFPADKSIVSKVGAGYELLLSKDTLKHGYIHPDQPTDKRLLIDLGVDDASFIRAVNAILKPGGLVMIYNLSPPMGAYHPWADGHDPFPRDLWEKYGFEVIQYDQEDDEAARAMARALKWNESQGMNPDTDLFALFTLLRKKAS